MQRYWKAHYDERWGAPPAEGADAGPSLPLALAYSHRANRELAWRTTSWSAADSADAAAAAATTSVEGRTMMASTIACGGAMLAAQTAPAGSGCVSQCAIEGP